jgi:hypothetical protein
MTYFEKMVKVRNEAYAMWQIALVDLQLAILTEFEKMAKIPELRPAFVTVTVEPQATIAAELPI